MITPIHAEVIKIVTNKDLTYFSYKLLNSLRNYILEFIKNPDTNETYRDSILNLIESFINYFSYIYHTEDKKYKTQFDAIKSAIEITKTSIQNEDKLKRFKEAEEKEPDKLATYAFNENYFKLFFKHRLYSIVKSDGATAASIGKKRISQEQYMTLFDLCSESDSLKKSLSKSSAELSTRI